MKLLLLTLLACGAEEAPEVRADPLERVAWTSPTSASRQLLVTLPAEVEALPDGVSVLGPRVPARIVQWLVAPGEPLTAGQPVALLDSPSLAGLQAAVQGQRRLRDAQQARLAAGVGTVGDVAEADAALASAAATLEATRSTLRSDRSGAVWSSPSDGVVAALGCAQGVEAGPSDACLTLVDPGRIGVITRVPERHLARLQDVTARWTGTDGQRRDGLVLAGREPVADRASRTVALRFLLPPEADGPQMPLTPGTSGRVDLIVAVDGGLQVPDSAVTPLEGRSVVFRRAEGAAEPVQVEVLGRGASDGTLLVTGPLQADDEIAWRGVFLLKSLALLGDGE